MKFKRHLFSTTIATILLLLSIIMPHHHHGLATCFTVEECIDSIAENHDSQETEPCVLEKEFLTTNNNQDLEFKLSDWDFYKQLNFLVAYFFQEYYNQQDNLSATENGGLYAYQYPIYYRLYSLSMGLRAPPAYS